jgi:hypothetical protein
MEWFDVLKKAIEESDIWKAPPPYTVDTDKRYFMAQLGDIPGLVDMLSKESNPLVQVQQKLGQDLLPRNTEIRIYPVFDKNPNDDALEKKTFDWRPSISGYNRTFMLVCILDDAGKPISNWQMGSLSTPFGGEASPKQKALASGNVPLELEEDEIGINILYRPGGIKGHKFIAKIDGHVGYGGTYWNKISSVSGMTEGSVPDDYDLINGEAAILLILTQIIPYGSRGPNKAHKDRMKEIADFGLGEWGTDIEDNKYVNGLVDKGLLERRRSRVKGKDRLPVPTAKGKAVSNRFEMKVDYFDTKFKQEVLAHPDEKFDSFEDKDWKSDDPDFTA